MKTKEIYDYVESLVSAAEKSDKACIFDSIWENFWEGVNKLRDLGIRVEYYDPDTSCKEDILACWNAYREYWSDRSEEIEHLLQNKPWKE